jgi:hypothetical protein
MSLAVAQIESSGLEGHNSFTRLRGTIVLEVGKLNTVLIPVVI